jgi:hypothetical protein
MMIIFDSDYEHSITNCAFLIALSAFSSPLSVYVRRTAAEILEMSSLPSE